MAASGHGTQWTVQDGLWERILGLPESPDYFLSKLRDLHVRIRDRIVERTRSASIEALSAVADDAEGDTIFAVDVDSEDVLVAFCREWAEELPLVLVAEGVGERGTTIFPEGGRAEDALVRLIVDPIDGTRGLMYDKRSAWILSGIAPNRGPETNLSDITLAYQTEIPTTKQFRSDRLWAVAGQGACAETDDLVRGTTAPLAIRPSRATTLEYGFASLSNFFPGGKALTSRIEEELFEAVVGPVRPGKATVFADQYISSGGQLYELMMGHDRFIADLRSVINASMGSGIGLCVRPYDICTELIAREANCIVTDPAGRPLAAPLDTLTDLSWVGYANPALAEQVQPLLMDILIRHGFVK